MNGRHLSNITKLKRQKKEKHYIDRTVEKNGNVLLGSIDFR
jgi:hypothetical protein